MAECTHDCSTCSAGCGERTAPQDLRAPANPNSRVKKVIAVVSGKGGVGKSTVTAMLAVSMARRGKKVGILDADITGPSIPRAFGLHGQLTGDGEAMIPAESAAGIKVTSINLVTENETDPVIWRGPILASVVTQFWSETAWGDVDYLFVDMPPGTGDVPLTVFQSLPVDGIVVVTSPQELVGMIVTKAVRMAQMMEVPILGLVENYSSFRCPDCGKLHSLFGESRLDQTALELGLPVLARLPIDPALAAACDGGTVERLPRTYLEEAAERLDG